MTSSTSVCELLSPAHRRRCLAPLLLLLLALGPSNSAGGSGGGGRQRRHTPFMPEDHWKGPPEFGATATNVSAMVNGTAELRCPIARVQDSAVSWREP